MVRGKPVMFIRCICELQKGVYASRRFLLCIEFKACYLCMLANHTLRTISYSTGIQIFSCQAAGVLDHFLDYPEISLGSPAHLQTTSDRKPFHPASKPCVNEIPR